MSKKYLEIISGTNVYLYDPEVGIDHPVAGINQNSLSKKRFQEATKNYYTVRGSIEKNKVYLEDCRIGLLKLKGQVDCIFTSPPYCARKEYKDEHNTDYSYNDDQPYQEYLIFMKQWMNCAYIAMKEGGVFGLNITNTLYDGVRRATAADLLNIAREVGFTFQDHIMWIKPLGATHHRVGAYIVSYQKLQRQLAILHELTKSKLDPEPELDKLKKRKKEVLAEIRKLKGKNKKIADLDEERIRINNTIKVLSVLKDHPDPKEAAKVLEDDAAMPHHPNPITEYIWIFSKGPKIQNRTMIDVTREKDQMFVVWYDKTMLQVRKEIADSIVEPTISREVLKDQITSAAAEPIHQALECIGDSIEDMVSKAIDRARPKLKRGQELTPTRLNKELKAVYQEKAQEVNNSLYKQIPTYINRAIQANEENIKSALSESFTTFLHSFTDSWHLAPTNTVVAKHPAPFPISLPRRFIELYLPKNGFIVDPFMGSGTTAQACIQLNKKHNRNYNFVGFDISKEYIDLANKNIQEERR